MGDTNKTPVMTQAEWIHQFNDQYRPQFNEELFVRDNQEIIDEVSKVILSCEKNIYFTLKVMSIDVISDYKEIYNTLRQQYESQRKKGDKTPNPYDFIQIRDSDILLLKVTYFLQKNGIERMKVNGEDMDVENPHTTLEVLIELPRFVDKYYFRLQGNRYIAINQIVDGSTYNNSTTNSSKYDNVTLKTLFMSVRIYRVFKQLIDVNTKDKIKTIIYTSLIFKHHINVMYYILAKYGLSATLEWFHCDFIRITPEPVMLEDAYCFKKHNLYVSVPKVLFDDEPVVQSLVATIYDGIGRDTKVNDLFTYGYWLQILGYSYKNATVDKGLFVLNSLESIYDINTHNSIRLPEEYKKDIYAVLKWLICEFTALRSKDNVDVSIKRRRLAEYIAHIYAMKITKGISRISDQGKKVKLKNIVSAIRTKPDYIISKIILMSNLVSYVDLVNDNDAIQVLKYSYKGISGLGESGAKVQPIYRFVDPSHLGILDLDASSVSDPGMSGMLCPTAHLYDNFFSEFEEVHGWDEEYKKKMEEYKKSQGYKNPFVTNEEPKFDYDFIKEEMIKKSLGITGKDIEVPASPDSLDESDIANIKLQGTDTIEIKDLFSVLDVEPEKEEASLDDAKPYVYEPYSVKEENEDW